MPRRLATLSGLLCLLYTAPAFAELVIFVDGRVLRAAEASASGDRLSVTLDNGGSVSVPLSRVARVIADEIDRRASPEWLPSLDPVVRFLEGASPPETPYGDLIFAAAQRHGLNPALVAAVMRAESAFNPQAVSVKGARGLMQLMPATAERFGLSREWILDPESNLEVGVRYLRWLADRFDDDLPLVLAGYNAGEGAVARHQAVPPYRETKEYIERIYRFLGDAS